MERMHTTPSRRSSSRTGMKGIVSSLSMGESGILAAGTFSRWVGLYDSGGRGETIAVFSLVSPSSTTTTSNAKDTEQQGTGITQLLWSPCSRYLCTVERGSDGICVWDVRVTGKELAWLVGRNARTNQRLGIDLIGDEIWAGGTDGKVRVWNGVGTKEGVVKARFEFLAHDGEPW